MSASRTRPATLGGKLSRKHVSLLPRSEAVGLVAAVVIGVAPWWARGEVDTVVHPSGVGKLELDTAASLALTRLSTFHNISHH